MDFLELCNSVNSKVGLQGSISDVTMPKGLQRNIVEAVRDAWLDIQTDRKEWTFLMGENSLFSLVSNQIEYTPTEVFGTLTASFDLSSYRKKDGIFYDYEPLKFIPYEKIPYIDNSVPGRPRWYSFNDLNNRLYFSRPDGTYPLVIRYKRAIQELGINTDVPIIHSDYHKGIFYAAVRDFSYAIGNSGLAETYRIKANKALSEIRQQYLTKKSVRQRGIA